MKHGLLSVVSMLALGACTTQPLTSVEISKRAEKDLQLIQQMRNQSEMTIGLEEAIALALKQNIDLRIKNVEALLAEGQYGLIAKDLLPRIGLDTSYNHRSVEYGSRPLAGSAPPPKGYFASEERDIIRAQLTAGYDLLELGINVARAKQASDARHMASERRRRSQQALVADVRSAYWRALVAQQHLPEITKLIQKLEQHVTHGGGTGQPRRLRDEELLQERQVYSVLQGLEERKNEMLQARVDLANLLGMPVGSQITLKTDATRRGGVKSDRPLDELAQLAFAHRPELRSEDYQRRINSQEVLKNFLSIFPSIPLRVGGAYDSNAYLAHSNWLQAGVALSWNLMRLTTLPAQIEQQSRIAALDDTRRIQVSMSVLLQVHLARARHAHADRNFDLAEGAAKVEHGILDRVRQSFGRPNPDGKNITLTLVETQEVMARVRRSQAEAEREAAASLVDFALGLDISNPRENLTESVPGLQARITERLDTNRATTNRSGWSSMNKSWYDTLKESDFRDSRPPNAPIRAAEPQSDPLNAPKF